MVIQKNNLYCFIIALQWYYIADLFAMMKTSNNRQVSRHQNQKYRIIFLN